MSGTSDIESLHSVSPLTKEYIASGREAPFVTHIKAKKKLEQQQELEQHRQQHHHRMEAIAARSFHGKANENVEDFITSIKVNFAPFETVYLTDAGKSEAKLALLKNKLKGKAASWAFRQPATTTSSWETMVDALKKKYSDSSRRDEKKRDAENELLNLKQRSLSLSQYIKKAVRISENLAADWDDTAAKKFIMGIKEENTRVLVMALGHLGEKYTLTEAIAAAKLMQRTTKKRSSKSKKDDSDSGSDSPSSSSSSEGSSEEESSERSRKAKKRVKGKKSKTAVIDQASLEKIFEEMMRRNREPQQNPLDFGKEFPQGVEAFAAGRQGGRGRQHMGGPFQQSSYQSPEQQSSYQPSQQQSSYQSPQQQASLYQSQQQQQVPVQSRASFQEQRPFQQSRYQPQNLYQPQSSYRSRYRPTSEYQEALICYRCGIEGHLSFDCVNQPLPREEQERAQRILEKYGRDLHPQSSENTRQFSGDARQFFGDARQFSGDVRQTTGEMPHQTPGGMRQITASSEPKVAGVSMLEAWGKRRDDIMVPETSLEEWFEVEAAKRENEAKADEVAARERSEAEEVVVLIDWQAFEGAEGKAKGGIEDEVEGYASVLTLEDSSSMQISESMQTSESGAKISESSTEISELSAKISEPEVSEPLGYAPIWTSEPSAQTLELNTQITELSTQTSELSAQSSEVSAQISEPNTQISEAEISEPLGDTLIQASEPSAKISESGAKISELGTKISEPSANISEPEPKISVPLGYASAQTSESSAQIAELGVQTSEPMPEDSENAKICESMPQTTGESVKVSEPMLRIPEDAKICESTPQTTKESAKIFEPIIRTSGTADNPEPVPKNTSGGAVKTLSSGLGGLRNGDLYECVRKSKVAGSLRWVFGTWVLMRGCHRLG